MTLLEMRTSLRAKIGNPQTSEVSDQKLDEYLNLSYKDITDRYRFHKARKRCQFTTVDGEARYDLPSDILVVMRVSDETNHKKLEKQGDRQLSARPDPVTTGFPAAYVRYRDWMELIPTPNGEYVIEIYYKFAIVSLVNDLDVPTIPSVWHQGIINLAKFYYYDDAGDLPKATTAYELFKLWVSDKPTEVDEESVDIDSGVELLSLSQTFSPRLDFDHGP